MWNSAVKGQILKKLSRDRGHQPRTLYLSLAGAIDDFFFIFPSYHLKDFNFQGEVFQWSSGDPCQQPLQLNASNLEHCPYLKGYDYFQVST